MIQSSTSQSRPVAAHVAAASRVSPSHQVDDDPGGDRAEQRDGEESLVAERAEDDRVDCGGAREPDGEALALWWSWTWP